MLLMFEVEIEIDILRVCPPGKVSELNAQRSCKVDAIIMEGCGHEWECHPVAGRTEIPGISSSIRGDRE